VSDFEQMIRSIVREELAKARPVAPIEFLSTTEAASVAKVAPGTVRRWVKTGRLTRHQAGRVLRVSRAELENMLRDGGARNDEQDPRAVAKKLLGIR
jgi:excisionase family DNA binding protein